MRRPVADTLFLALLVVAIAIAAWLSVRWQGRVDFSHGARATLSPASRDALAALDGPVDVVSWARPSGGLREPIAAFVARYTQAKPDLKLRFADPDADPQAARAQGVRIDGELVIGHGDRHERLTELNEREFTRALLRLSRDATRVIGFASGHGERRPDGDANHDFGDFAAALAEQGVRAVRVDLATQAIPATLDALVVADPRVPYGDAELAALAGYVESGGALWWLTEPASPVPLEPLA
ncbi:MAG TPA: Gldg family protein, partial [Xanthomonadales bacterium]|nr:Gldg family protein [Xanthomonadales bacterium]